MSDDRDIWVHKRADKKWGAKREGSPRDASVHDTQKEAWNKAKQRGRKSRVEVFLKNKEGKIRERNTYRDDPPESRG